MAEYRINSVVRLDATFRDESGNLEDPTTVTLWKRKGRTGTPVPYVYGIDNIILRDAKGKYHAFIEFDSSGWWWYGWIGTGTVEIRLDKAIRVLEWKAS